MNTTQTDSKDVAVLRRQAWIPVGVGAALIVGCWTVYGIAAVLGKDVLRHNEPPEDLAVKTYLIVSIVATLLGIPVAAMGVHKLRRLADQGEWTEATAVKIGMASNKGIRPVTFAYVVNSTDYTITRDVAVDFAECEIGSKVKLVYNLSKPASAEVLAYKGRGS